VDTGERLVYARNGFPELQFAHMYASNLPMYVLSVAWNQSDFEVHVLPMGGCDNKGCGYWVGEDSQMQRCKAKQGYRATARSPRQTVFEDGQQVEYYVRRTRAR